MEWEVLQSLKNDKKVGYLFAEDTTKGIKSYILIDPAKSKVSKFQQKTKKIHGVIDLSYFIKKSRENGEKNKGIEAL
jgi:hypothetical protein